MDEKYIEQRNGFIPEARKHANKVAGARPPKNHKKKSEELERYANEWNFAFHTEMDRLWNNNHPCPFCGHISKTVEA